MKRKLEPADILPAAEYARQRKDRRAALIAIKRDRKVEIGPFVTFLFECYETMWHQVQEMLYIEKGGAAQIAGELAAYNPLIPDGRELVATVLIEIEDADRRKRLLAGLGGIEETAYLSFAGETVTGVPETDTERTSEEGKASSVQFIHFPFTPAQIAKFRAPGTEAVLGFRHPAYRHMAALPETVRATLAGDFE